MCTSCIKESVHSWYGQAKRWSCCPTSSVYCTWSGFFWIFNSVKMPSLNSTRFRLQNLQYSGSAHVVIFVHLFKKKKPPHFFRLLCFLLIHIYANTISHFILSHCVLSSFNFCYHDPLHWGYLDFLDCNQDCLVLRSWLILWYLACGLP